jgi:hypothetical protein
VTRRQLTLPAVFGAVIAVLGAVAIVLRAMAALPSHGATAPSASPYRIAIACAGTGDACERMAADIARRARLSDQERAAGDAVATTVRRALPPLSISGHVDRCATTPGGPCRWVGDPPTAADVDQVRAALLAAGFREVTVRLARHDDVAPAGALLYAVTAGPACVVGWEQGPTGSAFVAGQLPAGGCLPP